MDCIFCKIIEGTIPSEMVYEDNLFLAILDINPVNKGHVLVLPKKHSENIFDFEEPEISKVMTVIKKISKVLMETLNAEGVNIIQNNGKPAGQIIFHSHFHIIPRYSGDGIKIGMVHGKYNEGEIKEYGNKIRAGMLMSS
ncbi:MAG: HIT family protein [Proteobacteria bacterium]|nr:HIT family protein [Pseudomonadota bacterium]